MVKSKRRIGMKRRRSGQALVEFALIIPAFLMLVLGVVEFGRAWQVYQTLTDAARDATRVAVLARSTTTVDSIAARANTIMSSAGLDTASAIKTVTPAFTTASPPVGPSSFSVSISYPYQLRWIQSLMGWTGAQASFNMNTVVTFRNER